MGLQRIGASQIGPSNSASRWENEEKNFRKSATLNHLARIAQHPGCAGRSENYGSQRPCPGSATSLQVIPQTALGLSVEPGAPSLRVWLMQGWVLGLASKNCGCRRMLVPSKRAVFVRGPLLSKRLSPNANYAEPRTSCVSFTVGRTGYAECRDQFCAASLCVSGCRCWVFFSSSPSDSPHPATAPQLSLCTVVCS